MTLNALQYFSEICKDMNISKTAARLFVSQQCLSKAVSRLESEFNCKLFVRSRSGVQLTPVGEVLLQQTEKIFDLVNNTASVMQQAVRQQSYRIVLSPGCNALLHEAIPSVFGQYKLECFEENESDCISLLRSAPVGESYDAAIISYPIHEKNFQVRLLCEDPLSFFLRDDYPIGEDGVLDLKQLNGWDMITCPQFEHAYTQLIKKMKQDGIALRDRLTMISPLAAIRACAENQAVLPIYYHLAILLQCPGVQCCTRTNPPMFWRFYLITRKKPREDFDEEAFYQLLRTNIETILK